MSRPKIILMYASVVLCATALFLYLRFPSDTVKEFISAQISRSAPGVDLNIGSLSPYLPAGVTLENVDLKFENRRLVTAEQAKITARPTTLISAQKSIAYNLLTCGGQIDGRAIFRPGSAGGSVDVKAKFDSIQLKDIPAIKAFSGYNVAGILDGNVNVNGSDRNGSTQTAFTIAQCVIELAQPMFGIDKLNFQLIDVELSMAGRQVIVKKCDLNGEEVDGRITGSLTLRQPYGRTRLNLSGVLKPQPAFSAKLSKMIPLALLSGTNIQRKGIPFKITGTLNRPGYSLR